MAVTDRIVLDEMEPRLRAKGYTLVREPADNQLPDFLRGYRPDAIAVGTTPSLVIEVFTNRSRTSDYKVRRIRELIEGRNDWRLDVVYFNTTGTPLNAVSLSSIRASLDEAEELVERHPKSALAISWASLEAIARLLEPDLAPRSMSAPTVLDLLVSMGHLSQDDGARLRALGTLRDEIVHGQVDRTPGRDDVHDLIGLARNLLP